MFFFRSHRIQIKIKKDLRPTQAFFLSLKVTLQGPVDPLTGMVVDLAEVDAAFAKLKTSSQTFSSIASALRHYHQVFKNHWQDQLVSVEIFNHKQGVVYSGDTVRKWVRVTLELLEGVEIIQREIKCDFNKDKFSQVVSLLRSSAKKNRDQLIAVLRNSSLHLAQLEIEHPEWPGVEICSLH